MHVCVVDGLKGKRKPQWEAAGERNKGGEVTNRARGGHIQSTC